MLKKLADKISAVGAEVVINTKGGSDADNIGNGETGKFTPETGGRVPETGGNDDPSDTPSDTDNEYILGSKKTTVVISVCIGAVLLTAVLILAYRSVYRRK